MVKKPSILKQLGIFANRLDDEDDIEQPTGHVYFVSTAGNDGWPGTISQPWLTWGKAFTTPVPGDTVYFRGGNYPMTIMNGGGYGPINWGTAGKYIKYWAYPDDMAAGSFPVLDCVGVVAPLGGLNHGIWAEVEYCWFRGLRIKNVNQPGDGVECMGWRCSGTNSIFENCSAYDIMGYGFRFEGDGTLYVLNCDAYNCIDSLSDPVPGNNGYGIACWNTWGMTGHIYIKGCRAWGCGDDGFVFYSKSYVECDRCWSFRNGALEGAGNGFKLGFLPGSPYAEPLRKVVNSLAVENRASGMTTNDNALDSVRCEVYNNLIWHNWNFDGLYGSDTQGIKIYNTSSADAEELKRIFKNNIVYANEDGDIHVSAGALYTHSNNGTGDGSGDLPGIITDADFINLAYAQLLQARKFNGDLPDITFGHLAAGSDCIGAGVNVGLIYDGDGLIWDSPPSIGAFRYS